jgi:phosphoglycerate dehydrogenase-like enzyme
VRGFHGAAGLDDMLGQTEVLVNLLPLTPETKGILNRGTFARMYRGGYLIQVGRGEHLVEADLLAALESGQLAGAALDVFSTEPLAARHLFWRHPNIVVSRMMPAKSAWKRSGRRFAQPQKRYAPAGVHRTPSTANAATERQQWIF